MPRIATSVAASVALLISSPAVGYLKDYAPFPPARLPNPFKVKRCVLLETDPLTEDGGHNRYVYGTCASPGDTPRVEIKYRDDGWSLCVRGAGGTVLADCGLVSDYLRPFEALWADLNNDGKPDYIIKFVDSGCGLAGLSEQVVVALSKSDTYQTATVFSMAPGDEDFVDLNADGRCQMIITTAVWAKFKADDSSHMFWVYNIVEFEGPEVTVSKRFEGFPMRIWYTFKPNHWATTRLTHAEKKRAWKKAKGESAIFWKPQESLKEYDK